jgi:hypothetical protein
MEAIGMDIWFLTETKSSKAVVRKTSEKLQSFCLKMRNLRHGVALCERE